MFCVVEKSFSKSGHFVEKYSNSSSVILCVESKSSSSRTFVAACSLSDWLSGVGDLSKLISRERS